MNMERDRGAERYEGGGEGKSEPEKTQRKGAGGGDGGRAPVAVGLRVSSASGRRWLRDLWPGRAHRTFPEPQRPCSPVRETQPAATPASPRRPARVRFPQRGTGTKPLHTQWPGSARGAVCSLAPRAAALTSGQRGSMIDRHPDLLHPALSQFQRHFRSCTRRPATPGGSDLGRRAVADPPGTKDRKGASACTRLGAPLRCFGKCALCEVLEDRLSGDTRRMRSARACGCAHCWLAG